MIFCPVCTGEVRVTNGLVTNLLTDLDTAVKWARFAYCEKCSMVSEIEDTMLVDLCDLMLSDLQRPFLGVELFSRVACLASLHGRRDS